MKKNIVPHTFYRPDIDGLRAVAVILVIIFHGFPKLLSGGFIGVDIFFVISGYLISSIVLRDLKDGSFRFYKFYSRRIRRIFPALLIVLAACFLFGWFALFPGEYKQLGKHIAGGAGFVSNFILWYEAGYFDNSADSKPLLHLWSLGVEEQFYILQPLLLWGLWKYRFNSIGIIVLIASASFCLNLAVAKTNGVAIFYSPLTRFWELLSGSALAYISEYLTNCNNHAVEPTRGSVKNFW